MRIATLTAMALLGAINIQASQGATVYVTGFSVVPVAVLYQAQELAKEMFARVGVEIDWRRGAPSRCQLRDQKPLVVELVAEAPERIRPEVLAVALPFEGVHITVFYDRVRQTDDPSLTPKLLALVFVHEITHLLEGSDGHSTSGVMKPYLTKHDYSKMVWASLPFAKEDVQLLRFGLAKRASRRIPGTADCRPVR
jgi:hypothetical protein